MDVLNTETMKSKKSVTYTYLLQVFFGNNIFDKIYLGDWTTLAVIIILFFVSYLPGLGGLYAFVASIYTLVLVSKNLGIMTDKVDWALSKLYRNMDSVELIPTEQGLVKIIFWFFLLFALFNIGLSIYNLVAPLFEDYQENYDKDDKDKKKESMTRKTVNVLAGGYKRFIPKNMF